MITETIKRITQTIEKNNSLDADKKQEILRLIADLKSEVAKLGASHGDAVDSIVSYAESSVREAVSKERNPELFSHTLKGMALSARRFEVSHPTLIGIINTIGHTLSNIGI